MNGGAAQVLQGLRSAPGGRCSGQKLSADLGVTRTQIWKHVNTLREHGYQIEGEPGDGYRLAASPDRLYAEEVSAGLETNWLAREIEYLEETDSTNRVASDRGREARAAGYTVIAERQTAGRGRLGRSFFSPPYRNLYTSVLLRPSLSTADAPTLIHAAAVGCANAIAMTLGDDRSVEIKWPNDILLDGLKTCGILMEMSSEATRLDFAVLGVGVNLNVDRADFPDEFRARATSLRCHADREVDRKAFTQQLYYELERAFDAHASGGFEAVREAYEQRFRMFGRKVRVEDLDGSTHEGRVEGVATNGALILEPEGGPTEHVLAGDVTVVKGERLND